MKEGIPIATKLPLIAELPDAAVKQFSHREIAEKAKEALIVVSFREYRISQGKAAEIVGISRYDLFDLMRQDCIPIIDLALEELEAGLKLAFRRS